MDASGGRGTEPRHTPVFTERVLALFEPALQVPNAVLVDATVGLGGHTQALLDSYGHLQVIGLDRDSQALAHTQDRLAGYGSRVRLVHAVYDELPAVLDRLGLPAVHGVLFDLGVSSLQLDEAERGFAYARDAPLDMRMDPTCGPTAADVLNTYPVAELTRILRDYGEERFARRIAEAIARERASRPFDSSARLVELVRSAIPAAARRTGGHPAKRTFQALRIEVNAELAVLERALPAALAALAVGGRIVVLSYQSLEDRIVKRALAAGASSTVPPELPVVPPQHGPQLRLLTRGAEQPEPDEVAANPRAASARLRAAERIRAAA
jgi:16S rRNA (cytosine1402-N4)-methyltransferase